MLNNLGICTNDWLMAINGRDWQMLKKLNVCKYLII